jgi:hypothetical protein
MTARHLNMGKVGLLSALALVALAGTDRGGLRGPANAQIGARNAAPESMSDSPRVAKAATVLRYRASPN